MTWSRHRLTPNMTLIDMRAVVLLLVASVCGCSSLDQKIGTFTQTDLANAAAIAGTLDTQGASCWQILDQGAAAASPAPQSDGIAVVIERKRLFGQAMAGPCAAVIGPELLSLIGKFPVLAPLLSGL